jgi:hypothetical protein
MSGETSLALLLKNMQPQLNDGEYVFCSVEAPHSINIADVLCFFREKEGVTVVISRELADQLELAYSFTASWITLSIHSALEAVGLTAAVSKALADENISCNVVAAYYHDHIFIAKKDAATAMDVLRRLSATI